MPSGSRKAEWDLAVSYNTAVHRGRRHRPSLERRVTLRDIGIPREQLLDHIAVEVLGRDKTSVIQGDGKKSGKS